MASAYDCPLGSRHMPPTRGRCADFSCLVNVEAVLTAGGRCRFEFGGSDEELKDLENILQAIVQGRLVERAGPSGSTYEVSMVDGETIKGKDIDGLRRAASINMVEHQYAAYSPPTPS